MGSVGRGAPTAADRVSRALIRAGDKAGGNLGFKVANAVSSVLLNRDWKPVQRHLRMFRWRNPGGREVLMAIRKKVSDALDKAAEAVVADGYSRGPKTMAVANIASGVFLGRFWVRCRAGKECTDPRHEHVDLD
jgi:hypothetical protein